MKDVKSPWIPCMKSWNLRSIGLLILSSVILCWAIIISVLIALEEQSIVTVVANILICAFGICQFLYFLFIFVIERRKYQMSEEGLTISYGGSIRKFYPWTMFQKILVCDFDHAPKYPPNCSVIIRLAAFEEPHGPHSIQKKLTISGIDRWRGYHYTMRNFTKILFLEYTPELLEEVKHFSQLQVMFSLTKYGKEKMASIYPKNSTNT